MCKGVKNHSFDKDKKLFQEGLDEIKKYIKKKPEINSFLYEDNICNLSLLELFFQNNNYKKFNNIILDCYIYYWFNKQNRAYYDCQSLFNLILISLTYLEKKGLLIINLGTINSQLSLDLIALIQYYFEEIYLIKPNTERVISDEKKLVAKNFKGINDKEFFNNLKNISKDWFNYEKSCGLDIKTEPEEDKFYVTSIFNYKDNFKNFKDFIELEDEEKLKKFNTMYENYNYVKNNYLLSREEGMKAEKFLITQIFKRSLNFLKVNNIPIKVKYSNIDRKILDISFDINEQDIYKKFKNKYNNEKSNNDFRELYDEENRLKIYKRKMDSLDPKKLYNITKIFTKPFFGLKDEINLRIFDKVSQGFIKMYEMLVIFNLIDKEDIKSFHLCEAPGQFIKACQIYIERNIKNSNWYWNAQSLHPSIGGALKDNYGLIKEYPTRWDFGKDKSGDITKIANIKYYGKKLNDYDLVTFDCGLFFDESNFKQTYQDKFSKELNFASILIVLSGLKKGGNFVNKVFLPQSLPSIICLNYIIITHFKETYIYKPLQNPNSSEIYFVAKYFKGIDEKLLEKLYDIYKKKKFDEFFIFLPQDFISDYTKIMNFFIQQNINGLITTYYYYGNDKQFKEEKEYIRNKQKKNNQNWLRKFNLFSI